MNMHSSVLDTELVMNKKGKFIFAYSACILVAEYR